MRRARVTYEGAFHHLMNRGVEGKDIFSSDELKSIFLGLLREKTRRLKIRLLAYCLMDNHYHLILQNSSGKLSDFMRQLNGHYGMIYRKKEGGRGYIFQGRYKSTLIDVGPYLQIAIIYVLLNPVRAGLVKDPFEYRWSSIDEYFGSDKDCIVDRRFAEDIFQNISVFEELLTEWSGKELPVRKTRFGSIIGGEGFGEGAIKRFDRRKEKKESRRKRKEDYVFKPLDMVIEEFQEDKGIRLGEIDTNTVKGKRLRGELLALLKDEAGLTYNQIIAYPLFQPLKYSSLGHLYKRAKERMKRR